MSRLIPFFLFLLLIVGCAASADDLDAPLPVDVQAALDAESANANANTAQLAANRARATAQAASQFATAARRATVELLGMEGTRIAGEVVRANLTETAVVRAGATSFALTQESKTETARQNQTADARSAIAKTETANARATSFFIAQVSKTESAQHTATAQHHTDATATYIAQAPTRIAVANIQANEDALRAAAQAEAQARAQKSVEVAPYRALWDMFWLPVFLSLFSLVLLLGMFLAFRAFARYVDSRTLNHVNGALQKRVILDRNGAPVGFITEAEGGAYIVEPIAAPALPDTSGAPKDNAQAHNVVTPALNPPTVSDDADALLRVNNPMHGDRFISRATPEENDAKVRKQLALRLLRDAMQYYANRNLDTRVAKVPTYRDLDWSSETWVRAVDSLKPYIITKSGRGGGTFCGPEYPHLVALYDAVGQNRVIPRPPADVTIAPSVVTSRVG